MEYNDQSASGAARELTADQLDNVAGGMIVALVQACIAQAVRNMNTTLEIGPVTFTPSPK